MPETLTDIGDYAFYACGNLSEITVPFGVQTIGQQTFAACDSLTEAVLQGVTTIGNHAFYHCDTLVSVTLPGSLTTLGDYVFYGCPIPELTIPASVTSLGSFSLFARTIIFQGNAPTVGSAPPLCGSNSTVYYPAGNATWTVTAMKRFGSNLTWIADNGVVEEKYIDSGACGENLTWKLHINGILTISGSGAMKPLAEATAVYGYYAKQYFAN